MPDLEQKEQNDFMIEKIKERPVNKKKLLRRTIITASMAVIFGLIACFTFLILEPVINNWLYPEEEPQIIVFPEDQEEMSPEEMLSDNMQAEHQEQEPVETPAALEKEQIQEILSGITLDVTHYKQLYSALSSYINELKQYMVTITGVTSNIDWFNNVQESKDQTSGVIIANNGRELLILADDTPVRQAEKLSLTFHNGVQAEAQLKQRDSYTSLAVFSVELTALPADKKEEIVKIATLGSSNLKNLIGMPVVAVGSPMGSSDSIGYGIVTASGGQLSVADRNYKLFMTDIYGSENAGGVLFNLQGQVVGIITDSRTETDMKNNIYAYGITELKKVITKMSNGEKIAYAGISGVDVTDEANRELGVPYGAYVKEVDMDSPAMLAGIQQGDVLVEIEQESIINYGKYVDVLLQMQAGDIVEFKIMRQAQDEYKEMNFSITLGESK